MLEFEELNNQDLKIILTPEGREELTDLLAAGKDSETIWYELTEAHRANGSYQMVHPEKLGALTDSPIIGIDFDYDEENEIEESNNARYWWFPNYMVINELDELLEKGFVIFTSAL